MEKIQITFRYDITYWIGGFSLIQTLDWACSEVRVENLFSLVTEDTNEQIDFCLTYQQGSDCVTRVQQRTSIFFLRPGGFR